MHPIEISHRKIGGIAFGEAPSFHRGQSQVINNAEMREQVELLKYHPDIFSNLGDVPVSYTHLTLPTNREV